MQHSTAFAYRVYPNTKKHGNESPLAVDAMFLMNTLIMLLLWTRGWPEDYVWVVLPVALFLLELLAEGVKAYSFIVVGLAAFLFNVDVYPRLSYFYYYYYYPHVAMINMITTSLSSQRSRRV